MSLISLTRRPRWRYGVPVGALAVTAAAVVVPQVASGAGHPQLPAKTAAQLLASLHDQSLPKFTGTVVETTNLGLPDISGVNTSGLAAAGGTNVSGFQQVVTLLTGSHTAQLAYGGPTKQRLALFIDNLSETDVVHNGRNVWTYSSSDNSYSHYVVPPKDAQQENSSDFTPPAPMDPNSAAQAALRQIDPSTRVSVQRTAEVAGRPAYQLVLQPRNAESTVQSVDIAIDSATSLPLRVQVWARGITSVPALEVAFTNLRLGAPSASTFGFVPPHGAVKKSNPLSPQTVVGGGAMLPGRAHAARPAPGQPGNAHPAGQSTASPSEPKVRMVGKDWTTVAAGQLPNSAGPAATSSAVAPFLGLVDHFGTKVPGGRLLRSNLVNALVTPDGHFYVGAVTPAYLEQLAARGTR